MARANTRRTHSPCHSAASARRDPLIGHYREVGCTSGQTPLAGPTPSKPKERDTLSFGFFWFVHVLRDSSIGDARNTLQHRQAPAGPKVLVNSGARL